VNELEMKWLWSNSMLSFGVCLEVL